MADLFSEIKTCDYCGLQPKPKPDQEHLFNGFKDGRTGHLVCWNCRDRHYKLTQPKTA